jgi:hypothetical protein
MKKLALKKVVLRNLDKPAQLSTFPTTPPDTYGCTYFCTYSGC